jgi:hypothetical protein
MMMIFLEFISFHCLITIINQLMQKRLGSSRGENAKGWTGFDAEISRNEALAPATFSRFLTIFPKPRRLMSLK